jgi:uncharacterized protein
MTQNVIEAEAAKYAAITTEINARQVAATLQLLIVEDCTVPFITRYRKEATGGLDEEQIRAIHQAYEDYLEREKRRAYILETLEKMEVLTPALKDQVLKADTLNQLEDIYAPYKSKKKTKGQLAKDAGLDKLADLLFAGKSDLADLEKDAEKFLNPDLKFKTWDDCLKGAQAIIAETFAHDTEVKETLRKDYWEGANLVATKRKDAEQIKDWEKFKDYFEFSQPIKELTNPKAAHRFLAVRRGMSLKVLKVEVAYPTEEVVGHLKSKYFPDGGKTADFLEKTATKAATMAIQPSLDLEVKTELKKVSDEGAIDVFNVNLKNLLLQPYLGAKTVLALDPGVRTGCKTVVVDNTGKLLFDTVVYPHEPQRDIKGSQMVIERLIDHYNVEYIAIGNGTYGRETLHFIEEYVAQVKEEKVKATLVNESGASIYSASEIAKKEFPDKDATVRGAVSIARRFQDPLAELVKIDPKSIGVGQYQHDVNQSKLKKSLMGVVESCVNYVGVDLNTASAPLLSFVSGIGPSVAGNIVKKREELGGFKSREELLNVSRFSQKVFEQSGGFLRIYNGENPLDGTFIHPEQYSVLEEWTKKVGTSLSELTQDSAIISQLENDSELKEKIGEFTHKDIVSALKAPSQDPRTEFKSTEFRKGIRKLTDLEPGQWYTGIVTNITQFGAFVDIGIKENGLVHVSEMADHFVSNALEVLKVGQEVKARVIEVDENRGRISLSLKTGESVPKGKSQGRSQGSIPARSNKPMPQKKIKNNALEALKNYKVK